MTNQERAAVRAEAFADAVEMVKAQAATQSPNTAFTVIMDLLCDLRDEALAAAAQTCQPPEEDDLEKPFRFGIQNQPYYAPGDDDKPAHPGIRRVRGGMS
jgi:hypothetical protein